LDAGASGHVELRLRRAGLAGLGVDGYRKRQLAYTVFGVVFAVALAVLLGLSTAAGLVLAAAGLVAGSLRWRAKLDRLIEDRRATMRAEAHTVCQMLAVWLRTGDTPPGALDRLARRATGVVPAELTAAAALIRSGSPPVEVLDRLAVDTAEPAAARLYRLYGASWSSGGDPAALLALADDLRAARRDAFARTMAKRRVAMAIPLVAVIGPILILFIAAAIPSIVFGR
jgi:tight adherence protein C